MASPSLFTSFKRSQLAALIATGFDFITYVFLVEWKEVWVVFASGVGAFVGAIVNFVLGRYWAFQVTDTFIGKQAVRYAIVSGGSLLLNAFGVWLFTEQMEIQYMVSKILTALAVALFYNFPLQKFYVFKAKKALPEN